MSLERDDFIFFLTLMGQAGIWCMRGREEGREPESALAVSPVHMLSAVPLCGEVAKGCEVSLMLASGQSLHQGRGRDLSPGGLNEAGRSPLVTEAPVQRRPVSEGRYDFK